MAATTIYAIATFDRATKRALETAQRLAVEPEPRVVLLVPGTARPDPTSVRAQAGNTSAHYRALAACVGVNAAVCLCLGQTIEGAIGLIPKDAASPIVVGGLTGRWLWPSPEERLMRGLVRLGHHVIFVDAGPVSIAGV